MAVTTANTLQFFLSELVAGGVALCASGLVAATLALACILEKVPPIVSETVLAKPSSGKSAKRSFPSLLSVPAVFGVAISVMWGTKGVLPGSVKYWSWLDLAFVLYASGVTLSLATWSVLKTRGLLVRSTNRPSARSLSLVTAFLFGCGSLALVIPPVISVHSVIPSWRKSVDRKSCWANMVVIDVAKQNAALEYHLIKGDKISWHQVKTFRRMRPVPSCPDGGQYVLGHVGQIPSCSIHGNLIDAMQELHGASGSDLTPIAMAWGVGIGIATIIVGVLASPMSLGKRGHVSSRREKSVVEGGVERQRN